LEGDEDYITCDNYGGSENNYVDLDNYDGGPNDYDARVKTD